MAFSKDGLLGVDRCFEATRAPLVLTAPQLPIHLLHFLALIIDRPAAGTAHVGLLCSALAIILFLFCNLISFLIWVLHLILVDFNILAIVDGLPPLRRGSRALARIAHLHLSGRGRALPILAQLAPHTRHIHQLLIRPATHTIRADFAQLDVEGTRFHFIERYLGSLQLVISFRSELPCTLEPVNFAGAANVTGGLLVPRRHG